MRGRAFVEAVAPNAAAHRLAHVEEEPGAPVHGPNVMRLARSRGDRHGLDRIHPGFWSKNAHAGGTFALLPPAPGATDFFLISLRCLPRVRPIRQGLRAAMR